MPVLPSNSSLRIFHENKTSSYKVQLPHHLELDITKWEVALSQFQFPNNFYTIQEGCNTVIKEYNSPSKVELNNMHSKTESEKKKEKLEKVKCRDIMYTKN